MLVGSFIYIHNIVRTYSGTVGIGSVREEAVEVGVEYQGDTATRAQVAALFQRFAPMME